MKMKEKRRAKGLSQADLAALTGISVRVIQDYEQGARHINNAKAMTVYKIATALGCTIEDLLELENNN